jgi:FSR family fosmidomycin resistance protein-like MFS transporter
VQESTGKTSSPVLPVLSFAHLLNDTLQSIILSIYPMVKSSLQLRFSLTGQINFAIKLLK